MYFFPVRVLRCNLKRIAAPDARHVWALHSTNRGPHAAVLATARLAVQVKVEVQGEYDNSSRRRTAAAPLREMLGSTLGSGRQAAHRSDRWFPPPIASSMTPPGGGLMCSKIDCMSAGFLRPDRGRSASQQRACS